MSVSSAGDRVLFSTRADYGDHEDTRLRPPASADHHPLGIGGVLTLIAGRRERTRRAPSTRRKRGIYAGSVASQRRRRAAGGFVQSVGRAGGDFPDSSQENAPQAAADRSGAAHKSPILPDKAIWRRRPGAGGNWNRLPSEKHAPISGAPERCQSGRSGRSRKAVVRASVPWVSESHPLRHYPVHDHPHLPGTTCDKVIAQGTLDLSASVRIRLRPSPFGLVKWGLNRE